MDDYLLWLEDEDNGRVSSKSILDISYKAKLLSKDYLVSNELRSNNNLTKADLDSVRATYDGMLTLLFRIAPREGKEIDIMKANVHSKEEFKERVMKMTFNLKDNFYIKAGGQTIKPTLVNLENDYGITPGRNVYLVFPDKQGAIDLNTEARYDLVYEDEVFNTGINSFKFSNKKELPLLKLN